MKRSLRDLKLVLVYVYEWVIEGKQHSAVLKPIDAANGVILEETFDGSGIMRGLSVSGGLIDIPIDCITNHFQTWWKVQTNEYGGSSKTIHMSDQAMDRYVNDESSKKVRFDENGELKAKVTEEEKPPADAKRVQRK